MSWIYEINSMKNDYSYLSSYRDNRGIVDFSNHLEDLNEIFSNRLKVNPSEPPIKKYILKIIKAKNIYQSGNVDPQSLEKSFSDWGQYISGTTASVPAQCTPIYLMTNLKRVGFKNGNDLFEEEILYIGKTNVSPTTRDGRFKNGHAAISKLHHPKWYGDKKLYLAQVNLLVDLVQRDSFEDKDENYETLFPLEWIEDKELQNAVLKYVENILIELVQPEVNIQLINEEIETKGSKVPPKFDYPIEYICDLKDKSTPIFKELYMKKFVSADKKNFSGAGYLTF